MKFTKTAAAILDMDGVLWRGDEALPGLTDLFDWLHGQAIPYVLATNNSSKTPQDYVDKLTRMGVTGVPPQAIITSSTATAAYMRHRYPAGTRVFVVGMHGLRMALDAAGYDVDPDGPIDVVVSGIDTELTYERLKTAALHIRAGADFIGTNPDRTFPMPFGLVPGAGSIQAALEAATDRQPLIIGKPYPPMFEIALEQLGTTAGETLMIGDRLDTDIAGAKALGLPTVLLFTGVTTPEVLATSDLWADAAYDDLPALLRAWAGDEWWQARVKARRTRG
jgi:4-nitrophenyl phosphatase